MNTEILTQYINSKRSLSKRTKEEYLYDIRLLLNYLDIGDFSEITADHIEKFLDSRKTSPSLTNRRLSAFNSFFKYLLRRKLVISNPVPLVEREKKIEKEPKILDSSKLGDLRQACDNLKPIHNLIAKTIVEIFYNTGIRFSELLTCDVDNLDLKKMELKVMGKGGIERSVPISPSLIPLLNEYICWRNIRAREDELALFITSRGRRISKSWLSHLMSVLRDKSNISGFRAHILRHTFATDAIERGARRESVQLMLGHKRPSTTDIYIHITPDVRKNHDRAFP